MKKQTPKSMERNDRILLAAQKLFNAKGFEGTSISDIMKEAGAAKGAFYYYFETKDQILDVLVEKYIESLLKSIEAAANSNSLGALEKLKVIFQTEMVHDLAYHSPENHLHDIRNVDMHQRIIVMRVQRYAPVIGGVLEQGIREGVFKVRHPLEAAEFIISGFHFLCDTGIFSWSREQYFYKVKAAEEIIEKTLGLESESFAFLSAKLMEIQQGNH